MFANLPPSAAFVHSGARDGFESVCFRGPDGSATSSPTRGVAEFLIEGGTAAVEDGVPWSVQYRIAVDPGWLVTRVEATGIAPTGHHQLLAEIRDGRWWVNDRERPDLDGCLDVDFESSLVTNTIAVHRINAVSSTTPVETPAAFVRAEDLRVERLEQTYLCVDQGDHGSVFDYTSSTFGFACQIIFDASGVVTAYPGLGRRNS